MKASRRLDRAPPAAAPTTAIGAKYVSQHTALFVFGMAPRRFLEVVRAHPDLPRTKFGKLVLVPVDALEWKLRELGRTPKADETCAASSKREPETPDEVLALLGRRRVGP